MLTVLCSICLCASILIAALALANFIVYLRKKNIILVKSELTKRSGITPFHILVLGVFVAATIIYVPVFATLLQADGVWTQIIKTPLLSAQNALQLFVLNAGFDNITETINADNGLSPVLADVYTAYASIYFVVAPIFTTAFALSFVKGLYENWRYFRNIRMQEIYVFSELNERSLALAEDIVTTCKPVKRVIVFANVSQKLAEENDDLMSDARDLGAICLQKDITDIYLKSPEKQQICRKLYLISQDENENTSKALQLIAHCHKNYNFDTTHIYVFANSDESGILIDSVISKLSKIEAADKEIEIPFNIKVRRVNEKRNLIWSALRKSEKELDLTIPDERRQPTRKNLPLIFSRAEVDGDVKNIDVLIVGLGQYGTELLKTICWYCQMPDYRLRIHVFDGLANCEGKVRSIAPELVEKNHVPKDEEEAGEAYYDINFCNEAIDVREASFADKLRELPNVTLAFVTLGDDQMNIDTAIKLRRIFGKIHAGKGFKVPPILTVVYDSDKAENLKHGKLLKNDSRDGDYNIRFIGDLRTSYSLLNVEQAELESAGLACHMHWAAVNQKYAEGKQPTDAQLQANWLEMEKQYNTYEYSRRSSMAQVMHLMAREQLCRECDRVALMQNEHKRWNAYMRADGYTVSPIVKDKRIDRDTVAKIHPDLIPFAELSPDKQEKDDMPEYSDLLRDYEEKSKFFAHGVEKIEK